MIIYNNITSTKFHSAFSFKSSTEQTATSSKSKDLQLNDEFVIEQKTPDKKKKRAWTSIAVIALVLALIADIAVEHKLTIEKKARNEEKKLTEQMKKELEEKTKKLEEEIKKQKEAFEQAKKSGTSDNSSSSPDIDIHPPKS